jgi:hypothetical protein
MATIKGQEAGCSPSCEQRHEGLFLYRLMQHPVPESEGGFRAGNPPSLRHHRIGNICLTCKEVCRAGSQDNKNDRRQRQQEEQNVMRKGVIIYVAGDAPQDWTEADDVRVKRLEPDADLVEVITTMTGHFDIIDAWKELVSRGMQKITCKMAVFGDLGQIEFTGHRLRLCG